jgi:hypothetical protein
MNPWPLVALGVTWAIVLAFWAGYWYAKWLPKWLERQRKSAMTVKNPPPVVVVPESVRKPKPTPIQLPKPPRTVVKPGG